MTLKQALGQARGLLAVNNIEDASLEAELLLRHTLRIDRVQLYLDLNRQLSTEQEGTFWRLVERRMKGEPSAYITGHREFYGLDFYVDHRVLIPRPETELLVEKAISLIQSHAISIIAEIGTGCGAVATSLALKLPAAEIYATDISAPALEVALINSQQHGVADRVHLLKGDMLDPLPEPVELVVANLPYVEESELARTGLARFEPWLALYGGSDGLKKIYKLCRQLSEKLCPQGCLLLEVGDGQGKPVAAFLQGLFPSSQIEVTPDFSGIERVVSLRLTPSCHDAKIAIVLPD